MERWWMVGAVLLTACSGVATSGLEGWQPQHEQADAATAEASEAGDAADGSDDASVADGPALDAPDAAACEGYADPDTASACHACSGATCQPNGCFNGYYCDTASAHCVPKPDGC